MDNIEVVPDYSRALGVPMLMADFEAITDAQIREWTATERFALITMVHVFEHMYDPLAALAKLRRLVADDGRVFIRLPDHGVAGFERDLTPGHFTIHPYFHALGSLLELCVQGGDLFDIESTAPMDGRGTARRRAAPADAQAGRLRRADRQERGARPAALPRVAGRRRRRRRDRRHRLDRCDARGGPDQRASGVHAGLHRRIAAGRDRRLEAVGLRQGAQRVRRRNRAARRGLRALDGRRRRAADARQSAPRAVLGRVRRVRRADRKRRPALDPSPAVARRSRHPVRGPLPRVPDDRRPSIAGTDRTA